MSAFWKAALVLITGTLLLVGSAIVLLRDCRLIRRRRI